MTVYNKLKIAILTFLATQPLHAITLAPLQVLSASGDLLYAEMNFSQADLSSNLQVSLATPEDLMGLGIAHQPPAQLNFFARRNGQGSGVIVITSSRPYIQPELDIVLKIQEGNGIRLQHIKQTINRRAVPAMQTSNEKPLAPKFIVSEKDIALNLPESTRYSIANTTTPTTNTNIATRPESSADRSQVLAINTTPPPTLQPATIQTSANQAKSQTDHAPTAPLSVQENVKPANASTVNVASLDKAPVSPAPSVQPTKQTIPPAKEPTNHAQSKQTTKPDSEKAQAKTKPVTTKEKAATQPKASSENQHIVQRNESLWSIANRIATQTNQPISQVMQQIKAQNSHAFIQGDVNRLRQGVALNLASNVTPNAQKTTEVKIPATSQQTAGRAKYRLNQAEMNLIADNEQDSTQGSAKHSTKQEKSNSELSLKVMTAREKTVKLQQSVSEMELALRQKDQRIQLLNARLAQLQQQLKARENAKKPLH